jgi:hypothetical protein
MEPSALALLCPGPSLMGVGLQRHSAIVALKPA